MIKKLLLLVVNISLFLSVNASGDDILFEINDTEIKVSEFEYIYNKNNFNNKADYSEQSLKEYLELYINFRLKVKEAEAEGLDNDPKLMSELKVYQQQLYNSFYDRDVLKSLVDETSNRLQEDVAIAHIFTNPSKNSAAKKMINDAYAALEKGTSFEDLAAKYSDDNYTRNQGGLLGFYTALQISFYELENAAYNTPVGKYSQPIKTSLGYHIIKVHSKRPARGEVKVGIIKLNKTKDEQKNILAQEKINTIYAELLKGKDFKTQVISFSEDLNTKDYGGELPWFGISQYDPVFEEEAFKLEKTGELSKPFQTGKAWYVIKLIEKKTAADRVTDIDALSEEIKKSDRYKIQRKTHIDAIIVKHGYKKSQPTFDSFKTSVLNKFASNNYKFDEFKDPKTLFTIGNNLIATDKEFAEFITSNSYRYKKSDDAEKFEKLFDSFLQDKAIDFHIIEYGKENKEYGALLREYRDGILLFDLMEKKVWSKAVQDSTGLKNYFEANKSNFKVGEKATVKKYSTNNAKSAALLKKFLKVDPNLDNKKYLAKLEKKGVSIVTEDLVIEKTDDLKKSVAWSKGSLNTIQDGDKFFVYQTTEIIPERTRKFEDAKGFAIAGYQEYLEKEWIKELRSKFNVKVNDSILKKMVK